MCLFFYRSDRIRKGTYTVMCVGGEKLHFSKFQHIYRHIFSYFLYSVPIKTCVSIFFDLILSVHNIFFYFRKEANQTTLLLSRQGNVLGVLFIEMDNFLGSKICQVVLLQQHNANHRHR